MRLAEVSCTQNGMTTGLLHGSCIFSLHRFRTSSFTSVRCNTELPVVPPWLTCISATMRPRSPVPEPNSRTDLLAKGARLAYKYREEIGSAHRTWVSNEMLCQDKTRTPGPQPSSATLDRSTRLKESDRAMFYRGNGASGDEEGFCSPIMRDKRWWRW
jgi:hypothetical protein